MSTGHKYTPEQDAWLREHAQLSRAELTAAFNEAHGTNLTQMAIKRYCVRHRILTGRTGRFEDGHATWQTGVRGEDYWAHFTPETRAEAIKRITPKTRYADGDVIRFPSQNGMERVKRGRQYLSRAAVEWEKVNGPIPADHLLVHIDGDPNSYTLDALQVIPMSWMSILAGIGGLTDSRELNETKLAYCATFRAIKNAQKGGKQE